MEHYQIINNSISKYDTDSQGVCPCQRMRTKGNKIVSLDKHIDLLNYTFEVIYGTESDLTARQVESACTALLERGGYSASVSHIIELQYNINRELTLRVIESSPYKDFALRAVRPNAYPFSINCFEATLQTSASVALVGLLRNLSRHYGCDIPLCIDNEGKVWSIDGASPIIVKGKKITISATIHTVQTEVSSEALANLLNYQISFEPISFNDALEADELFYVDSRGITSVRSLSEHIYSDNVANLLHRSLNFIV
jgi:hypothetical protein